jgi:hypothetical protein
MKRILLEIPDKQFIELVFLLEGLGLDGIRIWQILERGTVRSEDFIETSEWGQRNPDLQAEVNRP